VLVPEDVRAWIGFCQRVYAHAAKTPALADGPPRPHVVPQTDLLPFRHDIEDTTHSKIPRLERSLGRAL
jgi:hypothetical protein